MSSSCPKIAGSWLELSEATGEMKKSLQSKQDVLMPEQTQRTGTHPNSLHALLSKPVSKLPRSI